MAATKQPTNSDILAKLNEVIKKVDAVDGRLTQIEIWRLTEESARKAVAEYRSQEKAERLNKLNQTEKKEWIKVAQQVGVALGIVIVILSAIAASRGLSF